MVSKLDRLSNAVAIKRRELEAAIIALYETDTVVGLGSLEHSKIMLDMLKKDIHEDHDLSTLEGRIADAQDRIAARPDWLKGR